MTLVVNNLVGFSIRGELGPQVGHKIYTGHSGYYTWTVPAGVTSVCVVCVGKGGDNNSGGGGGLGWKNNIPVTPGENISISVGDSSFKSKLLVRGGHGGSGHPNSIYEYNRVGSGGIFVGDGGGMGGDGGPLFYHRPVSGGGGAGGYTDKGGEGGYLYSRTRPVAGRPGKGGGGGGGGGDDSTYYGAGGGGGVGLYGQGTSGVGGKAGRGSDTNDPHAEGGKGGSGGSPGGNGKNVGNSAKHLNMGLGGKGGNYGGGGSGNGYTRGASINSSKPIAKGGYGAVRIIWGEGRSFPHNAQRVPEDIN